MDGGFSSDEEEDLSFSEHDSSEEQDEIAKDVLSESRSSLQQWCKDWNLRPHGQKNDLRARLLENIAFRVSDSDGEADVDDGEDEDDDSFIKSKRKKIRITSGDDEGKKTVEVHHFRSGNSYYNLSDFRKIGKSKDRSSLYNKLTHLRNRHYLRTIERDSVLWKRLPRRGNPKLVRTDCPLFENSINEH